jgi:phosphomannomutase/phosphoglucomutase
MAVDIKAPKRTLAFYNRLAIWVALLFISLGLCMQSLQVNLFTQASLDKEYAQAMAHQIAHSLRIKLSATQAQQKNAALHPNTIAYLKSPDTSWKRTLKSLIPNAEQVFILDNISALGLQDKLGYAVQALATGTLKGKEFPLEAVNRGGKIHFYLATPITDYSKSIIGILLIEYGETWLTQLRSGAVSKHGLISARQVLRDNPNRGLEVFEIGKKSSSQLTVVTESINDYWYLTFIPADTRPQLAQSTILTPWIFTFFGTLIALLILTWLQRHAIKHNKLLLFNYTRQLFRKRENKWPKYTIDLFHELAKAMEHLADSKSSTLGSTDYDTSPIQERERQRIDLVQKVAKPNSLSSPSSFNDSHTAHVTIDEVMPQRSEVPISIFRSYDIRGTTDLITADTAHQIGLALGTEILVRGEGTIILGWDGRTSSPELAKSIQQGLLDSGCNVINIGAVTTGCFYYACHELDTQNGVIVTGSHNPSNINGFKIVIDKKTLLKDQLMAIYHRIQRQEFRQGQGIVTEQSLNKNYINRIQSDIQLSRPLKVVLDAGNGISGPIGSQLLKTMGINVVPIFCDVDGQFPNHIPNPNDPSNLATLQAAVVEHKADIGIAYDGDGDRIAITDEQGNIIASDRLLMFLSKDIISRQPGCDIVYDIKSSSRLNTLITQFGGRPTMWKTGHSLIKLKMTELDAALGGELSGHIYFRDRWYGFDDALYASARLLELISHKFETVSEIFEAFPDDFSTAEIAVAADENAKFEIIKKLETEPSLLEGARVTSIDGIRSDYQDGWGLVRASNTSSKLTMRFAGKDEASLRRIQQLYKAALQLHAPELHLPF